MPVEALLPLLVIVFGFVGFCLFDLSRSTVQYLPRWLWALVIIGSVPVGGIAYLAFGRKHQ